MSQFDLEAVHPQPGDVIVVRLPTNPTAVALQNMGEALQRAFPNNHVLMLPADMSLEVADEQAMAAAGWVPIT